MLPDALGIDMQRILAFTYAYACLNASSWLRIGNQEIVEWYLKIARIIEQHIKRL
jgi:streptomycin 6-kinase